MMKRILSLALALVLLVSLFTPGILPVTTSAAGETEEKKELNIEVELVETAVLYTGPNMLKSVNLVDVPGYSTTVKVRYGQRINGILWYLIATTDYVGTDYEWYCYVKASDAVPTAAVGVDKDAVSLSGRNEKPEITATAPEGVTDGSAQWQINIPGTEKWANIRNNGNTLTVSYGLVAQLLDADHQVKLRVRWTANDIEYFSKTITVTYDQPENSAVEEPAADIALYDAQYGIATYADADVKKTYNIVINYVFENNELVSDPYTASLAEGSSFSATVTFPTQQGYLPYVNDVQQNSMELNFASISEDVTINVVYKPTNVNYTVIHYKQNVDNDQYTIESTEIKQGLTGSQVPEVAKTFAGFYSLLYERPAIAADGSTVIEVYYDRYYYLMNFDMDGGYGTEPVYTRYGAPIGEVTDPTKAGYSFVGWSLIDGGGSDTKVDLPEIMPENGKTYYAIWTPNDTANVTIVFWGENADDEGYSYLADYTKVINLKPGKEFTYSEDKMLVCDKEVHTHTDDCICCGKEEHSHNSDCYMQGAGLSSTLWKFEKSDTVIVAADGSTVVNVYYERKTFTIHFRKANSDSDNYGTITEKWGADIRSKFEEKNTKAGTALWSTSKLGSSPWTSFLDKMPKENRTYYANSSNGSTHTAVYYGEPLSGTNLDTLYTSKVVFSGRLTVTKEDKVEIDGFTYVDSLRFNNRTYSSTANKSSFDGATFYYSRNTFKIEYNNYQGAAETKAAKFGASIDNDTFNWTPTDVQAPTMYEPGSVTFGGWYLNPQCTGEPYDFTNKTMPAGPNNKDGEVALVLYAKWVPVKHTVKFYLTEKSESVYKPTTAEIAAMFTVSHGQTLDKDYVENYLTEEAMNEAKPNGDYTFVTWYYYENGEKKPFNPTTQIRKDLTLYGEWSSNTLKQYTIQYVLKSDHSVKVAKDETGSGLAGTTKTFDAKGGTELYAAYQEGYFPTVQSQSLLLDIESNSLVITFEYVPMPAVPYTVKYVEKDTGKTLADDKVVSDNRKAVVTETFKPISGYMPDAYQKRLVVTADGENILYFYYSKDETHAYYKITHYIQNTDGETWTEYASSQAVGDIGTRYTASAMTIPGFTYKETKYLVNSAEVTDVTAEGAKLTADGLEINLYYVRNEYLYQVRYLEQGSGKVLHNPKNGSGLYGQVISESAIDIEGYDKVNPTSATLNIRIDEGEGAPNINIITFYYKEKEVNINYVAVGPTGATNFGSVDPTTETVKVVSGTAQGSTPTAGDGFKFVGWYKDAACTEAVDASWVTDNKIVPQKTNGKNVAATYYAKFEYDVADLTITKTGAQDIDENQTFIFTITGPDNFKMTVVIKGNGSVTIKGLKVGSTYTIHEENGWSWRYECADKTVTLQPGVENKVTMENKRNETEWLDGDAYAKNDFNK